MYIAIVVMVLLISFVYYHLIVQIIKRIVLIEIVPSGLRIDRMKYDQHEVVIIPAKELDVEIETYRGRKRHRTSYWIHIRHKGDVEQIFSMREDPTVIGNILDGIEQQKLISLRAKEKDFLDEMKRPTSSMRILGIAVLVTVFSVIAYNLYVHRTTLRALYNNFNALKSPVVGFWQVSSGSLTFEMDLLTDSTVDETLFGKTGKWKYVPEDSVSKRSAKLVFYNEEKAFNEFTVVNGNDSMLTLQGKDNQHQFVFSKMKSASLTPVDSIARFIASFDMTLPMPPSNSSRINAGRAIVPEKEGLMPVSLLLSNDTLAVATFSGGWDYFVIVLDPRSKSRLEFRQLFHGEGCDASHAIDYRQAQTVIVQRAACEGEKEGEKAAQCFAIQKSGKVFEADCK
jgi:hypothetical protein